VKISNTLYLTNPNDWRNWLKQRHKSENEIWLVYPKKATGKPRIEYNAAVEQALCFGWIDSIIKPLTTSIQFKDFHRASRKQNTCKPTSNACGHWWRRRKSSKK
jgi:uncharacterized protein YdeI (YjbR/CyaY-like superfamily)